MTDNTDIAALVGSRICHDLISPVGAIGNGLELIGLSEGSVGPELDLISESVGNANARIRFFRIAFGMSGADQQIGLSEIFSVLDGLASGSRIQIDWSAQGAVQRDHLRMAFLAVMCLETAMPYGGILSVNREDDDRWVFHAEGSRLKIDPALWRPLAETKRPNGITPAFVQFGLLPVITQDMGRRISIDITETRLIMSI
ncbi:histidine phosphotransferase family protein [Shimia sp.]|uniref:histidine phosphotransferase family protein n=1 Tax=Shimia sp. TaxID=1954381 RepID=UPI00329974C8